MIAATAFTSFFRHWGAPLLAGGLAVGMGLGFWLYVDSITDAKVEAERQRDQALGRIEILEEEALQDSKDLEFLRIRREVEQALADERLGNETDRRVAAERRNSTVLGEINDLREDLTNRECGIGVELTELLRVNRSDREAGREPGTRSDTGITTGSLSRE